MCNIFGLSKKGAADLNYGKAASSTIMGVGFDIAHLIKQLVYHQYVELDRIQLIGHSLGAHASGLAGSFLPYLGRITGLDPAGPRFKSIPPSQRLHRSQALFVDVIHTNGGENYELLNFGLMEAVGHLDFYPDGGRMQRGCDPKDISCSHGRAVDYYLHTLEPSYDCQMISHECTDFQSFLDGWCLSCGHDYSKCALMGPLAKFNPTRGDNNLKLFLTVYPERFLKCGETSRMMQKWYKVKDPSVDGGLVDHGFKRFIPKIKLMVTILAITLDSSLFRFIVRYGVPIITLSIIILSFYYGPTLFHYVSALRFYAIVGLSVLGLAIGCTIGGTLGVFYTLGFDPHDQTWSDILRNWN